VSKLKLIIQREYLTRVRKKSFIIGTLMAPLGLLAYMVVVMLLTRYQSNNEVKVAVWDQANMLRQLPDEKGVRYTLIKDKTLEQLKSAVTAGEYSGVLHVPPLANFQKKDHTVFYYSDTKLALESRGRIEKTVKKKIREYKIDSLHLNRDALALLDTDISIDPESINKKEEDESKYTIGVGLAVGGVMAFIMFFMVLMYGQMVMRSVMEEKTNRVVEVMMSSVKPFELMLGKIIGAGAVGLTQVVAWVVLSGGISLLVPLVMGAGAGQMEMPMTPGDVSMENVQDEGFRMMSELSKQNWPLITFSFIVFFLGGYFIYSSLFAAIGSAMSDDMGEGQALVLPVTIPIVLAVYIVAFAGIRNPDSGLMVFASIFPLFSPIVMPFRMAFNPPWWQVALSLITVVLAALFFIWLAGRIYRVGILMYGKKVTLKEIGKWLLYR
jgi:ABC-2 type transport system permease protein